MSDLISKSAVIEMLHYNCDESCSSVVRDVENLSSVDAVEVVRCGECRYYRGSLDGYTCENEFWNAEYLVPTEPDDYCSYGERKEVNE